MIFNHLSNILAHHDYNVAENRNSEQTLSYTCYGFQFSPPHEDIYVLCFLLLLASVVTSLSCLSPIHIFVRAEGREPRTWTIAVSYTRVMIHCIVSTNGHSNCGSIQCKKRQYMSNWPRFFFE